MGDYPTLPHSEPEGLRTLIAKSAEGMVSMSNEIVPEQESRIITLRVATGDATCFGVGAADTFGVILRRLRVGRGLTGDQVAAGVGISVELLAKIEGGCKGLVNFELIVQIKNSLQLEYKDLVGFR